MYRARRVLRHWRSLAVIAATVLAYACAEAEPPVIWAASVDGPDVVARGSLVRVRVDAKPTGAWYFYSLTQPAGGPIPARIWLADSTTFKPEGAVTSPPPIRSFDKVFGIDVEKYAEAASFTLPIRIPRETRVRANTISVTAQYQACNDTICLSPRTVTMAVPITIEPR